MITTDNFSALLLALNFEQHDKQYHKRFADEIVLVADFAKKKLTFPKDLRVNDETTSSFDSPENFVMFECVNRLLEKGYKPESIELKPKWKLGHGASGGRADILVKDHENKPLLIIECKTAGGEYTKALKYTLFDGGQLFSYAQQIPATQFLCLYASNFNDKKELIRDYFIIPHKDNPTILEQDNELKSFKDAQSVIERFEVWKNTYQLEFLPPVIFDEKSQAYQIGKNKIELEDLNPIDARDKEGKYHQFRTILRKHNVARRENAFEVLVNLFLCKIVDETEHAHDINFYWKGIAYDNYFDLVDRLQNLYQKGMDRFLNQDIVYISNDEIDNAFWTVRNNKNATKQKIKEIFKQLKFYKGLDFDFIKVHNKELFDKNAKVLIEIVKMWQDSRLKTDEQNQFLGDMFEYFLDNGIKQSEGQFFTPMPICRFILMALPLPELIRESEYAPKMIDYACGAGHFLNEYAAQIKPFALENKQQPLKSFYANIVGIEKEDRLAKVAKVSAFMYGQDEIKIIDADALAVHPDIKNNSFNCLVANPPFAVEGFLETLGEAHRNNYELFKTVSDALNNRNIQCFFIERAAQLLAPKGIAGIIVPSSVLSNSDATHIAAREQLLKHFDIVALVELGSGTFGKTGTNTVVLFLRRKHKQPTEAEHFLNRVQDWFNQDEEAAIYGDWHLIKSYCERIGIDFEQYQSLLNGEPSVELLATELFSDYKKVFINSMEIKNLEKQKYFKDKTQIEKDCELKKRFLSFVQRIEQDKLFYFVLAFHNPQKVLVVKSPSDNKEQKKFLGYEWSAAKGSEGIKLSTDSNGNHTQPLYDSTNRDNPEKINFLIAQNFLGNELNLSGFDDLVSTTRLVDMLDFSRVDFDKTISLTDKKTVVIETKWDLVKISDLCEIGRGRVINHQYIDNNEGEYPVYSSQTSNDGIMGYIDTFDFEGDYVTWTTDGIYAGTCFYRTGKFNCTNVCGTLKNKSDKLLIKFLPLVLNEVTDNYVVKSANPKLMNNVMANIKIPLPDKEIQEKIVTECEAVDKEVKNVEQEANQARIEIKALVSKSKSTLKRLDEIAIKISDNIDPQQQTGEINYIGLENIESETGHLVGEIKTDYSTIKSTKKIFKKGDILYGKLRPNLNKVYLAKNNGICSTDILVFRFENEQLAKFYVHYFLTKQFNDEVLKSVRGQQLPRTSWSAMQVIKTPVPDVEIQKTLVAEIETLETKIVAAQQIINKAAAKKQAVLKSYL